jgi:excinuclease ABC subunit B
MSFQIGVSYSPRGDQETAIEGLVRGVNEDAAHQVLLGVTGSGKTFTMAKVIEATGRPSIVLAHNKTLAAQLYHEFKTFFPSNAVEYFVSYYDYYQPEAYIPKLRHLHRKGRHESTSEIDRLRLALPPAVLVRTAAIASSSRPVSVLHLRPGIARSVLPGHDGYGLEKGMQTCRSRRTALPSLVELLVRAK